MFSYPVSLLPLSPSDHSLGSFRFSGDCNWPYFHVSSFMCSCQGAKNNLRSPIPSDRTLKTIQALVRNACLLSTSLVDPSQLFAASFTRFLECSTSVCKASFVALLLPRKEVIQPHLPIRLPCYDFTPVIGLTLDGWLLSVTSPALGAPNSHGVTGGVYKARERIHRGMLIRDY